MPTRLVLRDHVEAPPQVDPRQQQPTRVLDRRRGESFETPPRRTSPSSRPVPQHSLSRVNFRMSLREDNDKEGEEPDSSERTVSSTDIRASPRLMGYLFTGLAAIVMLISIIQFIKADDNEERIFRYLEEEDVSGEEEPNIYTEIYGSTVLTYKLIGSIAIAAAGVFINLCILLMHLDTVFFPNVWRKVFCDGSQYERWLLLFLLVFWAAGLYFCTSSFSVGELQANVYFTAWIAFVTTLVNYGAWRVGAGRQSFDDMLTNQHETTRNWFYTVLFNFITALSLVDLYVHRDNLTFTFKNGVEQEVSQTQWNQALSVVWGCIGASLFVLSVNSFWKTVKCGSRLTLDGRFVEGVVACCMVGVWFWVVAELTGVNSPVNGPSNTYFGTWGTFLCSIMTFGTWLKENRDIVRLNTGDEPEEEDDESDESAKRSQRRA